MSAHTNTVSKKRLSAWGSNADESPRNMGDVAARIKVGVFIFQVWHSLKDAIGHRGRRLQDGGTQQEKDESGAAHFPLVCAAVSCLWITNTHYVSWGQSVNISREQ
jgi:hypothetical protein